MARSPVHLLQLSKNQSIENVLPLTEKLFSATLLAADELVGSGVLAAGEPAVFAADARLQQLRAEHGNLTLGRHLQDVTKTWFEEKESMSKLTIAHHYCRWIESASLKNEGVSECPPIFKALIEALRLESKITEKTVLSNA